jgi:signal transduction histidine kinase
VAIELHRGPAEDPDSLALRIRDNGTGFELADARRRMAEGGCMGLSGMEERVRLAGGRLEVRSQPGGGTSVWVHFDGVAAAHV